MRLRKTDDSGVLKILLRSVPNTVHDSIAGKQSIIDRFKKKLLSCFREFNKKLLSC